MLPWYSLHYSGEGQYHNRGRNINFGRQELLHQNKPRNLSLPTQINIPMADTGKGTTGGCHTSIVHIGTPPSSNLHYQDFGKTTVYIHNFAGLDRSTTSPDFYCLGYKWDVHLILRGCDSATADMVSIVLRLRSDEKNVRVEYGIVMNDSSS